MLANQGTHLFRILVKASLFRAKEPDTRQNKVLRTHACESINVVHRAENGLYVLKHVKGARPNLSSRFRILGQDLIEGFGMISNTWE